MAEKHRSVRLPAPLVPLPVYIEPSAALHFPFADVASHLFIEDLRTSAGHRIDTVFDHPVDYLVVAQAVLFGQKVYFGSRKSLYMNLRKLPLDGPEHPQIPFEPGFRVVGGDDVNLFRPSLPRPFRDLDNLFYRHRIGVGVLSARTVGAEFADIFAYVGRIDVAVYVEVGLLSVQLFPPLVSQPPKRKKVELVELQRLFHAYSPTVAHFFGYIHSSTPGENFRYYTQKEKGSNAYGSQCGNRVSAR